MDATGREALKRIQEVIDQETGPKNMKEPAEALEVLEELLEDLKFRVDALRDTVGEEDLEE